MATINKKIVNETEETIETRKELTQSEEVNEHEKNGYKPNYDFRYELKVDATVKKAIKQ